MRDEHCEVICKTVLECVKHHTPRVMTEDGT